MKTLLSTIFILFLYSSFGQGTLEKEDTKINKVHINGEFMFIPTVFYNQLSVGINISKNSKFEHVLELRTKFIRPFAFSLFSMGIHYNFNISSIERERFNTYVPIWARVKRINTFGSEEGHSQNLLVYSVGSGYGLKFLTKKNHAFRCEFGLGVSVLYSDLNANNSFGPFPFKLELDQFSREEAYPILPAARLTFRYIFKVKK